jgi:hypothetical protein
VVLVQAQKAHLAAVQVHMVTQAAEAAEAAMQVAEDVAT